MNHKIITLLILLYLIFSSCKRDKGDNNNLFLLALWGISQNSGVTFSGNFGTVSSSLNRSSKALPDGITDVIAISSRNHYQRSKVDSQGNFSVNLVKGFSYIILFIDPSLNVKGYYQLNSVGLNSIPTQYATNSISAGTIEKTSSSGSLNNSFAPVNNFNINQFLTEAGGLSFSEIGGIKAMSKELFPLLNIDSDGNGLIDLEEGLLTRLNFSQQWNTPINGTYLSNSKNNYVDLSFLTTTSAGFYAVFFAIAQNNAPSNNLELSYPIPQNCSDTSNNKISSGLQSVTMIPSSALPNGNKVVNSAISNYFSLKYTCNGIDKIIPEKGIYTFKNSGKSYTFKNIEPFTIDSSETVLVPTIKFEVNGSNLVTDIKYKFQKVSLNKIEDATEKEVNIVYGINSGGSGISCSDFLYTGSAGQSKTFDCSFNMQNASGSIQTCTNSNTILSSPINTNFSRYKDCYIYTRNSYGNFIGYSIY
jgi:hypothetical protein